MKQYPPIHGIGIDISQLMIEYATSMAQSQNLSTLQFRVMDATQPLAFPDSTFDLVNGRILMGFLSTQQGLTSMTLTPSNSVLSISNSNPFMSKCN